MTDDEQKKLDRWMSELQNSLWVEDARHNAVRWGVTAAISLATAAIFNAALIAAYLAYGQWYLPLAGLTIAFLFVSVANGIMWQVAERKYRRMAEELDVLSDEIVEEVEHED